MAEATKPQAAASDDQSMEEILQSIRRIIAEEGDDKSAPAAPGGSDVLELTDMVKDDGSVVNLKIQDAAKAPAPKAGIAHDVLQNIDHAISRTAGEVEALLSQNAEAKSVDALKALAKSPKPAVPAAAAITSPVFRSGNTVEDLVMEALRPMLKDWLDTQLPGIVERLVTREIKRITASLDE